MRKKTFNLYIIFIIILIVLVSFLIYKGTIENFEERKGHFMKKDKDGDLEHYSRVPVDSDPKDTFNYGVDTVPGGNKRRISNISSSRYDYEFSWPYT
jgi:uncharacterized protein YpmB